MFTLISELRTNGVIFVSGDRHAGEISSIKHPLVAYPIYDMTSSGLTNSIKPGNRREANPFRLSNTLFHTQRNFGIVHITNDQNGVFVHLNLKDHQGISLIEHKVNLETLKF
ncbi:MAG: hypothetical protein AB8G05_27775 [Oligoflexales bacterium]